MKKIFLLIMTLWCAMASIAQSTSAENNAALQLVSANRVAIGLSAEDMNDLMVTYTYVDKTIGVRYIYLQQTYQGIPVYNKTQAIAFKNNVLASAAGIRIPNVDSKVNNLSGFPTKTAESAVIAAMASKGFSPSGSLTPVSTKDMGRKVEFGKLGVSRENVTAQLMWFPNETESQLKLGWFVYYVPTTNSDYWTMFVDAGNGSIIGEYNLTVSCNWDDPNHKFVFGQNHNHQNTSTANFFDFATSKKPEFGEGSSPTTVNTVSYRVVPIPYEAPTFMPGAFPGTAPGNSTVVNNPWTSVPASMSNATTLNWHSDAAATDYNYTRGNNVWAYQDRGNANAPSLAASALSTTALPSLTFSAYGNAPDYTADPVTGGGTTGGVANNQLFNITNLFYFNNILHDVLYTHGFDEVARNFQANNLGRGGNGNDYVFAEAQDGSGTNNANFSTPGDGSSGRMQMYLWTTTSPNRDGDVDNGIIAHELGHGVSNRLMGSSTNQTGCVANGEHAGEGISDYIALMTTQDWATTTVNTLFTSARGIGTFALNQATTGIGIRSQRYCASISGTPSNTLKYLAVLPTLVHDRGEYWCAAAWHATGEIIRESGVVSPTIYYNSAAGGNGNAGNIAAMRIAMQAMKLVPCGTGFIEHRDGWLKADTLLYGGQYSCAIWRAFAARGMGFFANQGSANSASDQVPDETPKSQVNITTGVTSVPAAQNITYTNTASTCSGAAITGYSMQTTLPTNVSFVSATNGGTYNTATRVISWTVNMAAVGTFVANFTVNVNAGAFPGNVVMPTCLYDNSATPRLFNCKSVTTPITPVAAGCPTISAQPVNVTTCAGSSVSFSVTASSSDPITYVWQVSTNGGTTWTNLTNTAPYSNVTTTAMTINPTAVGLNNNQYRCFMTTPSCTAGVSSNAATLVVVSASVGGTVTPATASVCGATNSTTLTLAGNVGAVVRWESSTDGGVTWNPIAGTAGLTSYTATNIAATTRYRAVVQVSGGCAAVNSSVSIITFIASGPMFIDADPNAPICAGDPARLTASEGFGTQTFCNPAAIAINDNAPGSPYPSNITISGFPTTGIQVESVTLTGISHTWSNDIDILLQSPTGTNVILMSDVGGSAGLTNLTYTFKDGSPAMNFGALNPTGTYAPTNNGTPDNFPAPGPGSIAPATTTLASFTGDFNGVWKLFVVDDLGGDFGSISGGYCIKFTSNITVPVTGGTFTWTPSTGLNSTTTNPVAASPTVTTTYTVSHNNGIGCIRTASYTVVVNQRPLVATQPVSTTVCSGSAATFSITATGAGPLTYQWQVATSATGPWSNVPPVTPYSGETTATLTINPTSALLNNNWYRCVVGGICPPVAGSTSQPAKLTINPLPTVVINPVGPVCGGIAGINGTPLSFALTAPPVPGSQTFTSGTINVPIPEGNFPTRPATAASNVISVAGIPANATITSVVARLNATHGYANDIVAVLKAPSGQVINIDAIGGFQNNGGANYVNTGFSTNTALPSISTGTAPFSSTWRADLAGVTFTAFGFTLSGGPVGFDPTTTSTATFLGSIGAGAANGNWTLAAYDAGAPDVGNLTKWDLIINYTTPGTVPGTQNWVYSWSPTTGLYTNTTATAAYTGQNLQTVYAAPTALTTYTLTVRDTSTGCIGTSSVIVNYTPPAPTVTPNPVNMCLGDPAVLVRSSSSTPGVASFTTGTINVPILDNTPAGTTSTISVSGIPNNATITGIKATLNGTHTWLGDVAMVLKAPGTIGTLNIDYYLNGTGAGPTTNFVGTAFSSASSTPIGTASPFTGVFKADNAPAASAPPAGPTGMLPNVNGFTGLIAAINAAGPGAANGTYTLGMADNFGGDFGALTKWDLEISYIVGVPATPAVWSPAAGLFSNAAASTPYVAGTPVDSVWVRPTPAGTYNYNVTVQSVSPPPVNIASNHTSGNGNYVITFNIKNNNSYPVTLNGVNSLAFAGGASNVQLWRNTGNLTGSPGPITNANGWFQVGATTAITAIGGTTVQPFMTNIGYSIGAGAEVRFLVSCETSAGGFNMGYQTVAGGPFTFSASGVDLLTGGGIGWGGPQIPGTPANNPRGFVGSVDILASPAPPCTSPARVLTVNVYQPVVITTQPAVNMVVCTDKSVSNTVVATGSSIKHQWQISGDVAGNGPWTNLSNNAIYSGVTTSTLTITNPPISLNKFHYRDSVSGESPCGPQISNRSILTVNPLPTVVIAANPYTKLFPGLRTTLTNTSAPAAATYIWKKNGVAVPGGTNSQLTVDVDGMGDYTLTVTDVNGCVGTSNMITISDSASGRVFIYPNPNNGIFQVRYYSSIDTRSPRGMNVYDAKGSRVYVANYRNSDAYSRMDVDLRKYGTGVYWVEVVDANGDRLAVGRAVVIR